MKRRRAYGEVSLELQITFETEAALKVMKPGGGETWLPKVCLRKLPSGKYAVSEALAFHKGLISAGWRAA